MEFKHTKLENGLTVIAEINPAAASMAAGFFVRTGSRDETPEVAGVSHFLEHMVFKGTKRRSALEVNLQFDRMGAIYNAFTSEENTVYFGAVLPEFQNDLLDLLADIMRPSLRGEDFDLEKNVIIEEIAQYQDQPTFRIYEQLMAEYFHSHPLANSVLGTVGSIEKLKRDDMQNYFDRRYSPTNLTVVAVGKVDFNAFVDKVNQHCESWKPHQTERNVQPAAGTTGKGVICDPKIVREHIGLMSPAPSAQDHLRYAAQLASVIVGDVTGSRLFYALVDPALAEEAHMSYDPMDGAGAFVTFVSTDPDRTDEVLRIVHEQFDKFREEGPQAEELQAAKNKIASSVTVKGELPMGRLTAVGLDWVYRGKYLPLAEQIDELFAVTTEQIIGLVRDYDLSATRTLALGPLEKI